MYLMAEMAQRRDTEIEMTFPADKRMDLLFLVEICQPWKFPEEEIGSGVGLETMRGSLQ